jgi:REP element-mobilizing transposase RayT
MARIARNVLPPSGIYHLTLRGAGGCDIHRDDLDRFRFLRFLKLGTLKANWRLLAFCLMRNHFHLVVDGELEATSRGMHTLAFRHAQAFNTRHERSGHLFGDRFYTRVIRDDEHLGAACAYVLQNAERVGIRDWPWRGGELANLG